MKAIIFTLLALTIFLSSSVIIVQAQSESSIWRDDMNYQNIYQLQTTGWTITHQAGVSFTGSAIVLDGTQEDTAIHYSKNFPSGISDWKVEDRSRWTLGSHCGNIVTAITNKHSYSFMADGWYGNYVFYRDGQKTTFGSFQESKNTWFTLAIEKQGNQINMYYNGEIKSTYTETDTSASQLIGVDAVSPWRGGSEYEYFEVWQIEDTSTQEAQQSPLSNPIVIGGIIAAVGVGVGGVLYFFVLGGSGAAGSSGGAGGVGLGQGGHGSSGSSSQPEHPYSDDSPYSSGEQTDSQSQQSQLDNSQNNNYDTQQPENNPYSSGQTDPQSQQGQYDNSQDTNDNSTEQLDSPYSESGDSQYTNNYDTQQPQDNPYAQGQPPEPQQYEPDNSQYTNNYDSSRTNNEDTKKKKSPTKTE